MRTATNPLHLITMMFVLALPRIAHAVSMDDFKQTYGDYQQAVDNKDWNKALSLSKKSLDEGLQIFNEEGQNIANLRFNYARELNRAGQAPQAAEQLKLCLEANEKMHGADSQDLLGVLMELGRTVAASDAKAAEGYYNRAVGITGKQHDAALAAKLKFEAGITLVKYEDLKGARDFLADAHDYYQHRFGLKDARTGLAALNLGKIYAAENQNDNARETLNDALKAFAGDDPVSRQFDAGTRRLLVPVLEALGRGDEATQHCVAIAMSNAASGSAKPELLYRDPKLALVNAGTRDTNGKEVAGQSGEVTVAYTVNEKGQPVDVSVKSSNNRDLNDAAMAFVRTFRYAPGISDGKPVATPHMEFQYHMKGSVNVRVQR